MSVAKCDISITENIYKTVKKKFFYCVVNLNFFIDYPRLSAPNTKYVGPMHLKEAQLLPPK